MKKENGVLLSVEDNDVELLERDPNKFFEGINEIATRAFNNLYNLKKLIIPSCITKLNESFINNCQNLERIEINAKISDLRNDFFNSCRNIKEIIINSKIGTIDKECFYSCNFLERVKLSNGLKIIDDEAFAFCHNLKRIIIPDTVEKIGENCFAYCSNLEKVKMPRKLKIIGEYAFNNCFKLSNIIVPFNVKYIGEETFSNCRNLSNIIIENKKVNINKNAFNNTPIMFVGENNGYISLSNKRSLEKDLDISVMSECFYDFDLESLFPLNENLEDLNFIMDKCKKNNIQIPLEFIKKYLTRNDVKTLNLKYYKQLYKYLKMESLENVNIFCNIVEALGLFQYPLYEMHISKSDKIITEKIDYAQKAGEFLKENISKDMIKINHFNYILNKLENIGFKRDFALFVLQEDNFKSIVKEIQKNKDFLSNAYNYFEEVQATNTNKNGNRVLKPTVSKFVSYFNENKFDKSNDYADISREIGKFYDDKKYFEEAIEIRKIYEEKKINPNILSFDLEEKTLMKINEERNSILKLSKEILNELKETSDSFTFEWLRKDDPHNYTLGKYCSCCAHLAQCGDGIAIASIINPDIQNLVLRDKQGTIVAKSTLYVNKKKEYGIFNNVEISSSVPDSAKERIYDKYILATKIFAEFYNKENPSNKLKQINVGMSFNNLYNEIKKHNERSEVLENIHYKEYSKDEKYDGDANETQYVIWKKTK